jgi:hypothetical protein
MDADATERSERFKYDDESSAWATRKLLVDDVILSGHSSLISVLLRRVKLELALKDRLIRPRGGGPVY